MTDHTTPEALRAQASDIGFADDPCAVMLRAAASTIEALTYDNAVLENNYRVAAEEEAQAKAERDEAVARASMMLSHSVFVECGIVGCTYQVVDYWRDNAEWAHRYQTAREQEGEKG